MTPVQPLRSNPSRPHPSRAVWPPGLSLPPVHIASGYLQGLSSLSAPPRPPPRPRGATRGRSRSPLPPERAGSNPGDSGPLPPRHT
eukprot:3574010-Prymnesium_polylepis.1